MFSILKKEIISYLSSLVAYVTIGVFLLVLGLFLWVFPESSILDYGYAGLDSLFSTAPFLFMFLIPAITMRSLAEERKEGTFELLTTRPLTDWQIVLGKYFACLVIVLFSLVPTLVYYYSVYKLGSPEGNIDTGGVIGSYIGLFLLGGAFCAIGLFASSLSKNQIIAFIIAIFLCYFCYSGFESFSQLLSLQNLSLENLGITEHYESVSRGVLDTRDLVYFIVLTGMFICLTLFVLIKQKQKSLAGTDGKIFGAVIGVLILLVIISSLIFTRFDFTKEKRYTISQVTRDILSSLQTPVKVTVYLEGDDFPGGMKRLQRETRDMLNDLQAYSHGMFQFSFKDPLKGLNEQDRQQIIQNLVREGIKPSNLSVKTDDGLIQKLIIPGALVTCNGREVGVNLLQSEIGLTDEQALNNSIQNLEYAFSSAIKNAAAGGKSVIAFTTGHHELTNLQLNGAMSALSDGYDVYRIDLKATKLSDIMNINLLIIPKPDTKFSELEKFKIDQYIMRGGRVLWAIDQVNAELDSLRGHGGEEMSFPKNLNLDDQLFTYGIRINYDLIADLNCAQIPITTGEVGGHAQIQLLPWLFYPVLLPASKNPIVNNLDGIRSEFVSTIDTLAIKDVKKTVLLSSSAYNKKINGMHLLSLAALQQEPDRKDFQSPPKSVAVLLEGRFKSDFLNRPLPDSLKEQVSIIPQSKPTKMIVISDGDVFKSQVASDGSPYPLGFDQYTEQNFGNKNLLLNIADYMTDNSGLIPLRAKKVQIRLLDRARIRSEKLYWQLFNNILPLALLLTFAIFQHYIRKRKYAY